MSDEPWDRLDKGGEWLAIKGSAGLTLEYGDGAWEPIVDGSVEPPETKLNGGGMLATGVDSPCPALLNIGLAKSDGDPAVVADMGLGRKSSPYPWVSIRRSVGRWWTDCGTGA